MTTDADREPDSNGTVTWISKNTGQATTSEIWRAALLLSEDGKDVDGVTIECLWGPYRYDIRLIRPEEGLPSGTFRKADAGSREQLLEGKITACLVRGSGGGALLLGGSPWVDRDGYEFAWKAEIRVAQQIPYSEWNP